jgi:hypothetical protein
MLHKRIEWSLVKVHLTLFVLATVIAAGAAGYLWSEQQVQDQKRMESHRLLVTLKGKIRKQAESLRLARRYRSSYEELQNLHFVGTIDRLLVTERINRTAQALELPEVRVRFDPDERISEYSGMKPDHHDLVKMSQFLEFTLRDETELEDLLERLHDERLGFHVAAACAMKRGERTLRLDGQGNIRGKCRLEWLHLSRQGDSRDADRADDHGGLL